MADDASMRDEPRDDGESGQPPEARSLSDVVDQVLRAGDGNGDDMTVGELLAGFGRRSFGPLILVPSILVASPLSAIPGFPSFAAIIVALSAGQMLIGRPTPWLPDFVTHRHFNPRRLKRAERFLRTTAKWVDRVVKPRLEPLTGGIFARVIAGFCLALAAAMPPLELIPMANTTTGIALSVFGLALVTRDGLLTLIAIAVTVAAAAIAAGIVMSP